MYCFSPHMDDLMADSLQLSCAVDQTTRDKSIQLRKDTIEESKAFLKVLSTISPHEQFQIFLYSHISSRQLKDFLASGEEVS